MRRTVALSRFIYIIAYDGDMEFGWCAGGAACQIQAISFALSSLESLTRRAV
jgi:hypothetical protein